MYRAWDEELGVAVALKTVRPEIAEDPAAARDLEKRFKRELLLARQVTHPNVVRIHDMGEIEGIKYITMPYVDGFDLSAIVKQHESGLPVGQVVTVARGVVSGLLAAHRAGVVHRDLKPANIMVEAGTNNALIMDFGIARSAGGGDIEGKPKAQLAPSPNTAGLTAVGSIIGTLEYMAPEQFRGEEVDHRADIYAFGLILYDLLAGRRRNRGALTATRGGRPANGQASSTPRRGERGPAGASRTDHRPLHRVGSRRALRDHRGAGSRHRPSRRARPAPAAAEALLEDLPGDRGRRGSRGTGGHLAASALTGAGGAAAPDVGAGGGLRRPDGRGWARERRGDPVFAGTLETAMGTALEGASFVNLYSRGAAHRLIDKLDPGRPLDVPMARLISAREGIEVIVGGTLERTRSGYSLELEAIDPAEGKVLGTATARAPTPEGMLLAVGTAGARLRGALGDTTPESARMAAAETVTTTSLEALKAYVRAQELAANRKDREALGAFEEAVELDPDFGRAYAGMGVLYFNLKDMSNAQASFDEALKLLDRMGDREKYRTLGSYYLGVALNYEKAVETYEALVEQFPADEVAHANLSLAYLYTGDVPRAIEQVREVLELNPRSTSDRYNLAIQSVYAGDFAGALTEADRAIEDSPTYEQPYLPRALATFYQGDLDGARAIYEEVEQLGPDGASLGRLGRADLFLARGQLPGRAHPPARRA